MCSNDMSYGRHDDGDQEDDHDERDDYVTLCCQRFAGNSVNTDKDNTDLANVQAAKGV